MLDSLLAFIIQPKFGTRAVRRTIREITSNRFLNEATRTTFNYNNQSSGQSSTHVCVVFFLINIYHDTEMSYKLRR